MVEGFGRCRLLGGSVESGVGGHGGGNGGVDQTWLEIALVVDVGSDGGKQN